MGNYLRSSLVYTSWEGSPQLDIIDLRSQMEDSSVSVEISYPVLVEGISFSFLFFWKLKVFPFHLWYLVNHAINRCGLARFIGEVQCAPIPPLVCMIEILSCGSSKKRFCPVKKLIITRNSKSAYLKMPYGHRSDGWFDGWLHNFVLKCIGKPGSKP
jgi:hypothetical protein